MIKEFEKIIVKLKDYPDDQKAIIKQMRVINPEEVQKFIDSDLFI